MWRTPFLKYIYQIFGKFVKDGINVRNIFKYWIFAISIQIIKEERKKLTNHHFSLLKGDLPSNNF